MRVFITGATGFVGRHVMEGVNEAGHDILASTLEKDKIENCPRDVHWLYGDLADLGSLKPEIQSFNPEVVIHLAWQGIPDYSEVISTINLNNSIELFDFILEETNCKKIVVSGSCFEYGKEKGECKESDPVQINSFFTWSKYSLYQYLMLKCKQSMVDLVWFRIFYVYGPGQRSGSLIPTLVQAIKDGKTPDIRTPLNRNDFVNVGDVARAFQLACDMEIETGIYNLGYGSSNSVYDVCRIVEENLLDTKSISNQVLESGSAKENVDFWANISKTKNVLGWVQKYNLVSGIKDYLKGSNRL